MDLKDLKYQYFKDKIQIVVFDPKGQILESCNTIFALEKQNESIFALDPFFESLEETLKSIAPNDVVDYPCIGPKMMDREGYFDVRIVNREEYFELSLVDLTSYYNFLLPLQQQRNDLEIEGEFRQIREKSLKLEKKLLAMQNEQQKKLREVKEAFFAKVNHEMRTPLNSISGLANLLLSQLDKGDIEFEEQSRDYLESLNKTVDHLTSIINDILDLSKIESGKMELTPKAFSLRDTLSLISGSFAYAAQLKEVKVAFNIGDEVPDKLVGDQKKLNQILYNVVGNAIKYTSEGSVLILVKKLEQNESQKPLIQFKVVDTGIGMNNEDAAKVFEPFQRSQEVVDKGQHGSGLGMSIVKEVVNLMQGLIYVESSKGVGTTVTLELPFEVAEEEKQRNDSEEPDLANEIPQFIKKVLIVEDDQLAGIVLRDLLKTMEVECELISEPEMLDKMFQEQWFDLVMLDKQLGNIDGLDFMMSMKQDFPERFADVPVILVTGETTENDNSSIAGVLIKPYNSRELRNVYLRLDRQLCHEEVVNLRYLKEITNGNELLMVELIDVFNREMPENLQKIRDLSGGKNTQKVERVLHKVIPNALYSGIAGLANQMIALETDIKEGVEVDLSNRIEEIEQKCQKGIDRLQDIKRRLQKKLSSQIQK